MNEIRTKIGPSGRVVIPASVRKELGIAVGDEVVLRVEDDELRIVTTERAIARAQALVRRYAKGGDPLSQDLIAERRREANGG